MLLIAPARLAYLSLSRSARSRRHGPPARTSAALARRARLADLGSERRPALIIVVFCISFFTPILTGDPERPSMTYSRLLAGRIYHGCNCSIARLCSRDVFNTAASAKPNTNTNYSKASSKHYHGVREMSRREFLILYPRYKMDEELAAFRLPITSITVVRLQSPRFNWPDSNVSVP